jgi:hypothetical protein
MQIARFRLAPLLALMLSGAVSVGGEPLRFFAMGDAPYSEGELLQLEGLLADAGEAGSDFIVHVGDIKSASSVCTDAYTARIANLFRGVPVPVAYTPGDNEWTDCWRAGGDPLLRLAALRRSFYGDPSVLRLAELGAVHPQAAYPENYYFLRKGVLFAAVHHVGSGNGVARKDAAAEAEWKARMTANRALLEQAVEAARTSRAGALVVFFQADPLLEEPGKGRGFDTLRRDLGWLLRAFAGPILVIHGDGHRYRLDQPLADPATGRPESRLTRLEVPGSPVAAGVWVIYDPKAPEPFHVERAHFGIPSDAGAP